ncbi:MAG TPA: TolC family outer membrane protein [Candidatus Omnitrophota bacterium]|nr:TolC family outer membrane protein [Candidatus Omnitrophota bacterium]
MRKACLLAGVALVGLGVMVGPEARAETLEEVLATTYNTNPTLQARRARVRASDENVPQALSNWRPTVRFVGEAARGRYESNNSGNPPAYYDRETGRTGKSGTLTLSQPLYRGGRTVAETRQAEASVLSERAGLQATEQTQLLAAATAFLNVVRDEAVLKLNINNEQVLRRQREAAEERFRVGEITRTDVSQAEARLARAIADRVQAEGVLQNSRANFINVVGRAPESPEPPKAAVTVPADLGEVKATTLAKNPNVLTSEWTAQAAKEGIDLVAGELLPTVSLNGEYQRLLSTTVRGGETEAMEATLQVSVPLYEAGDAYSRLRAQKHTYGQRRIEADQARRDAIEAATQSWEDLQSARARIKSFEAQIRASEMALAGVEEEAKVGSRTVLDVLDAEQELFDARVSLVRAQRDEMVAAFELKSALGDMTAQGLNLPVAVYDPVEHYEDVRGKWIGTGIDPQPGYEDYAPAKSE